MRHVVAGAVLIVVALAVTFGVATVLQDLAVSRNPGTEQYVPPSLGTPMGKPRPADKQRGFLLSRRTNDDKSE